MLNIPSGEMFLDHKKVNDEVINRFSGDSDAHYSAFFKFIRELHIYVVKTLDKQATQGELSRRFLEEINKLDFQTLLKNSTGILKYIKYDNLLKITSKLVELKERGVSIDFGESKEDQTFLKAMLSQLREHRKSINFREAEKLLKDFQKLEDLGVAPPFELFDPLWEHCVSKKSIKNGGSKMYIMHEDSASNVCCNESALDKFLKSEYKGKEEDPLGKRRKVEAYELSPAFMEEDAAIMGVGAKTDNALEASDS